MSGTETGVLFRVVPPELTSATIIAISSLPCLQLGTTGDRQPILGDPAIMSDSTSEELISDEPASDEPTSDVVNVPNLLTAARFVLAIVVFVLIVWQQYLGAMMIFIVAASTDWIDGYWARRFNQVTKLGRMFDPFVDKIIICGTFILLGAQEGSGIEAWMAVVVVGREMLVTALRSFIEQSGGDFSANMAGKLKMVFQCAAVVVSLWVLKTGVAQSPDWLLWTLLGLAWLAVLSTIQSGLGYVWASARFFRE